MNNMLNILNYLGKNKDKSFTMYELSKILLIPYASFHRTIKRIEDLLIIKKIGKSKVIRLNTNNEIITSYLAAASYEEKKEFLKTQPIIKKIASDIKEEREIVVLFGSYAKGTEKDKSDIDLLIINNNGEKTISFSEYELLYKKEINAMFFTKKEFRLMLKNEEENVGKQALRNHIILSNQNEFWRLVFDRIKQKDV